MESGREIKDIKINENINITKKIQHATMHPTAIWAMRPYCVDARPFAVSKNKKN